MSDVLVFQIKAIQIKVLKFELLRSAMCIQQLD